MLQALVRGWGSWVAVAAWALAAPSVAQQSAPAGDATTTPAAPSAPAASPPPLEAYGGLPTLDTVTLSPSGERYAFITRDGKDSFLVVQSIGERRALYAMRVTDMKVRDVTWADDDHLLVLTSVTSQVMALSGPAREWYMLQVCTLSKPACRMPDFSDRDRQTMNVVRGPPDVRRVDGRTVVYVQGVYVTDRTLPALFAFEADGSRTRLVEQGTADTSAWIVGADGTVVAESRYSDQQQRWSLRARDRNGEMHEIATRPAPIDRPYVVGLAPDGRSPVVRFVERDRDPVWHVLSPDDGSMSDPPVAQLGRGSALVDRLTGEVTGVVDDQHGTVRFLDPERQHRWDSVVRAHGETKIRYQSASDSFDHVLLLAFGAGLPPEYRWLDWPKRRSDPIGAMYAHVTTAAGIREIEYAAADGFRVPAILTLPPGREPRHLPLVVLPHGGPASYDTAEFDWWTQALASRGYVVLQPNFRGSSLGWAHMSAGFGEWGRKMQTDLSDGVAHLVAQGLVDPKRVCIVGASYGGYAALAGVALQTGVYRCAVAVAGISDLARMLQYDDYAGGVSDGRSQRYWNRFIGSKDRKDPLLQTLSPLAHADRVQVPVLLIHGKDDTIVAFEQSKLMAAKLRRRGAPVELVTLRHEDHWLSRSETRLQMLQAVVAFLEKANPAQ